MIDPSIYEDNAELVERVLREGADPNFIRDKDNIKKLPALSYAVKNNYSEVIDIFKALLNDPRTDVNKENIKGSNPLMFVCWNFLSSEISVELLSLLLKHPEIEVNKRNKEGWAALHVACEKGRSQCVKVLVDDDRIDINITDESGYTPLYLAVSNDDVESVKYLLRSSDIDPNILTNGHTSLHLAHESGFKEIVIELLKDKRTNKNIPDKDGKIFTELDKLLISYHSVKEKLILWIPNS